jgi:uncharacterized protein
MRRSLIAALLGVAVVTACATAAPVVEGPAQPALWAVRDADSTLYLYGTIHMRKQGAAWGGPAAEAALAEAQEVWTEVEVDPTREEAVRPLVARYGFDTTRSLSAQLSPERAAQLKEVVTGLGLPMQNVEAMKPWLASLTLSVLPMLKAGYDPKAGVDQSIDRAAEALDKRMRWFESSEEQIQFLSGFDQALQIQMLEDTLDEAGEGPAMLADMERAWEVGDDAKLADEMVAELRTEFPQLYDVLLARRNAAWTEVLSKELEGAGVDFVAVGAAHLAGPDSVQAMLRKRGYTVTRVTPPAPSSRP